MCRCFVECSFLSEMWVRTSHFTRDPNLKSSAKSRSPQKSFLSGWWFQISFIFTPTWGRFPFWLIFFRWVETTNQLSFSKGLPCESSLYWLFKDGHGYNWANYNDLTPEVTTNVSLVRESYPKWPKHSGFSGFTINCPHTTYTQYMTSWDFCLSRKKKKPWTLRMTNQMNKHPAFEGHPGRKMKPLGWL